MAALAAVLGCALAACGGDARSVTAWCEQAEAYAAVGNRYDADITAAQQRQVGEEIDEALGRAVAVAPDELQPLTRRFREVSAALNELGVRMHDRSEAEAAAGDVAGAAAGTVAGEPSAAPEDLERFRERVEGLAVDTVVRGYATEVEQRCGIRLSDS